MAETKRENETARQGVTDSNKLAEIIQGAGDARWIPFHVLYDVAHALLDSEWLAERERAAEMRGYQKALEREPVTIRVETTQMQQNLIEMAVRKARADERARLGGMQYGRCGDEAAPIIGPGNYPRRVCALMFGHGGWHTGDDGSEWTRGDEEGEE